MSYQNDKSIPKPTTTGNAPKFFVDHKKGEVNELLNLLRNPNIDKDITKKKDIIKRVIAYMTLGVDVSKLFHEMVKASITNDIILKKMVFLYIVNYADQSNSAILAINTFLKDLKNENPKIRGLALRSLCSLKFHGAYEYYSTALYDSLKDPHPYVRKTAVMGLLKVFHFNPKLISDKDIEILYEMIKDKDDMVVMNTLYVLNEILKKEGGIAISSKMIIHLLNILRNIILELVSRYEPKDEEQLYDILNILEDKLKHSSTAIVLACTKVFINFTKNNNFIYEQVLKRLKEPLITLVTSAELSQNYELSYVILSHIYVIILKGGRTLFEDSYKKFYVKLEESIYSKELKLKLLVEIANEKNYKEILTELENYVIDANPSLSKAALSSICFLAMRVDLALQNVVSLLKLFINHNYDTIVSESLYSLQTLLRKFPSIFDDFESYLEPALSIINNDERGLSSFLWIIGEFGEKIPNASYIIEDLVDHLLETLQNTNVAYSLLLAATKLFFKSPGEMQQILGKVFTHILRHYVDIDLRDRIYYIYNLLKEDIELAKFIINGEPIVVEKFYSELDGEYLDKIYQQFNTLSIVYQKPSEKFIRDSDQISPNEAEKEEKVMNDDAIEEKTVMNSVNLLEEAYEDQQLHSANLNNAESSGNAGFIRPSTEVNLLGLDSLSQAAEFTSESFASQFDLDQHTYQNIWTGVDIQTNKKVAFSVEEIENEGFVKYLEENNVFVKAWGENNKVLKLYLFSKEKHSDIIILTELVMDFNRRELEFTIKSMNQKIIKQYEEYLLSLLNPLL